MTLEGLLPWRVAGHVRPLSIATPAGWSTGVSSTTSRTPVGWLLADGHTAVGGYWAAHVLGDERYDQRAKSCAQRGVSLPLWTPANRVPRPAGAPMDAGSGSRISPSVVPARAHWKERERCIHMRRTWGRAPSRRTTQTNTSKKSAVPSARPARRRHSRSAAATSRAPQKRAPRAGYRLRQAAGLPAESTGAVEAGAWLAEALRGGLHTGGCVRRLIPRGPHRGP